MMSTQLRYLAAVSDLPLVTPTGRVLDRTGYCPETCLYVALPRDVDLMVPDRPTREDVKAAMIDLVGPWSAYRFTGPDDAAGLVSGILAAVAQPAVDICPMYFFDASTPGAGKTKAATALGALIEGRRPAVTPFAGTGDEEELKKQFIAIAVEGRRFFLLDNVLGTLRSAVLAGVVTTGRLGGRFLGHSRNVDASVRTLVTVSGNNMALWADLVRRTETVRLEAGVDPTRRAFAFDPVSAALAQRRRIAEAACVIWRAYFNAGAPDLIDNDAGGFAHWNRLCRQPVLWLAREGLADALPWQLGDPGGSMLADAASIDPELEVWAELLRGLYALSEGGDFEARDVLAWFKAGAFDDDGAAGSVHASVREVLGLRHGEEPSARKLGWMMRNRRDRAVSGLILRARANLAAGVQSWRVVRVE